MIEQKHKGLSIVKQCELLSVHRSGLFYQPKKPTALNQELKRLIDEQYLKKPYYCHVKIKLTDKASSILFVHLLL